MYLLSCEWAWRGRRWLMQSEPTGATSGPTPPSLSQASPDRHAQGNDSSPRREAVRLAQGSADRLCPLCGGGREDWELPQTASIG